MNKETDVYFGPGPYGTAKERRVDILARMEAKLEQILQQLHLMEDKLSVFSTYV